VGLKKQNELEIFGLDSGYGCGDGYGSDCGYGYGCGYGSGYGISSGDGSGESYVASRNDGYGAGCVEGYGCGCGVGYGYGYSNGEGYGYRSGPPGSTEFAKTLIIPEPYAWDAYHCVRIRDGKYVLRDGRKVRVGEELYEPNIKLCVRGLHASLSPKDAVRYAPPNSVLTKVKVWGKVQVDKDKLVATNRKIVEIIK